MPPADRLFLDALSALASALEEAGAPSMLIGGVAVIVRGVPRQTVDIDATIWAEGLDVEAFVRLLARHRLEPRVPDALAFARQHQVLLLRHQPSGTPLEVSFAWLDFEREALERATVEDIAGVRLRVATADDLIVFKAVAWRDRDRADIERLLATHWGKLDLARIRELVRAFSQALEEPERVAAFETLVTRAAGDAGRG
jgi:hypothetical protein